MPSSSIFSHICCDTCCPRCSTCYASALVLGLCVFTAQSTALLHSSAMSYVGGNAMKEAYTVTGREIQAAAAMSAAKQNCALTAEPVRHSRGGRSSTDAKNHVVC